MRSLVQGCIDVTGRTYPDGYGFALTFLSDTFAPAHLRSGAFAVVAEVFGSGEPLEPNDSDVVAFVSAYASGDRAEYWLIEAAQLVLQAALAGSYVAKQTLAICGHPGYDL